MLTDLHLEQLQQILGVSFKNQNLLKRALTHRSLGSKNNERLEFLGDSILGFIIAEALYQRFPNQSEGQLTRLRSRLVQGQTLSEIAKALTLDRYLQLGAAEQRNGGHQRASTLEDALEAVIGALYLDQGFEKTKQQVLNWYQERLEHLDLGITHKDPKTCLQEYCHAKRLPLPVYQIKQIIGQDHEQVFYVNCCLSKPTKVFEGSGQTRRAAEQVAAGLALKAFGINHA